MIEELLIEEVDGRMICRYFPPHVKFEAQLMQRKPMSEMVSLVDSLFPEGTAIGSVGLSGGKAYEIIVANGGAYYVAGPLEDGIREAWLWKLTAGSEAIDMKAGK